MSSWWKAYLISFKINLVPPQYLVGKVFKSSIHSIVSAESYVVVMGLIFTLGILAPVGEHPKYVKRSLKMPQNVLLHGHHLRRPARAPQPRWRPKPIRLRFSFGLQEQPAIKWTPRLHTELDLDVLYMVGKIISIRFQWNRSQAQIHLKSMGIVRTIWSPESDLALRRRLSVFGLCIVLEPIRGASKGSCMTLESS